MESCRAEKVLRYGSFYCMMNAGESGRNNEISLDISQSD